MLSSSLDFSSLNSIKAKVELYNGSTLVDRCSCADKLQSFTVDRSDGSGKFFGFGVCQSVKTELIDLNRELNLTKGIIVVPAFGDGSYFVKPYPKFYTQEITRDEDTNGITIVAYDKLYEASAHTFKELALTPPYTMKDIANACVSLLGLVGGVWPSSSAFTKAYENGANYSGEESLREVLDDIAEAIQAIYFINTANRLVFKRLDKSGSPLYTITKDNYFSLSSGASRVLSGICHTTELGDNVEVGDSTGAIQYVRDNPFWVSSDDIATDLTTAINLVKNLTINEFDCDSWEGNCLLEIGDKIAITAEDGSTFNTYVLNDSIIFDGTMMEATSWAYNENDNETAANPITLGEKLNQTRAKVDKALQEIELYAGKTTENTNNIASLMLTTNGIQGNVEAVEKKFSEIDGLSKEIVGIKTNLAKFELKADEAILEFKKEINENGVSKVSGTGFSFDETGLTISSSGVETSTNINSNGLAIYSGEIVKQTDTETGEEIITNEAVLVVKADGVRAENLRATTWLIIGNTSRLEDWNNRTACFWIGG